MTSTTSDPAGPGLGGVADLARLAESDADAEDHAIMAIAERLAQGQALQAQCRQDAPAGPGLPLPTAGAGS